MRLWKATLLSGSFQVVDEGGPGGDGEFVAGGLLVTERGGITVNDRLETSDARVFAIGECAVHSGMVYGLVAPGYEMAEIVAANLTGGDRRFDDVRGNKRHKLDLEAAIEVSFGGRVWLCAFGSGSTLARERAVLVDLTDVSRGAPEVRIVSIAPLIARAIVRGAEPDWIKQVYSFALKPDAVFYLRIEDHFPGDNIVHVEANDGIEATAARVLHAVKVLRREA